MRQLLNHMDESGVYTDADLSGFRERLGKLKEIVKKDEEEGRHPEPILRLMKRKMADVERILKTLIDSLSVLSIELVPIHEKLVPLRRKLAALATEPKPNKQEVKAILEDLRKLDS
jgi:DNA-binding Lrp family transcriptional regulator